jgi:GAF domain-containing protein
MLAVSAALCGDHSAIHLTIRGTEMPADRLVNELTLLLAQEGDRYRRAKAVAEAIRASGPYRWTGIYDVDLRNGIVSNIAWSGAGAPAHPTFPITSGLTSRAIVTKKAVNVGDVTTDPDYLTALASTRSEIIIPVLDDVGNCVLGTIDIESDRTDAFDSATQERLEACANALRAFWIR